MSISCDCSIDGGYNYPEFWTESFPVARKEHTCCECREKIMPGQKYHRATGKWDGEWATYRTCMACYKIREHYCPHGYGLGDLRVTIMDCLGFDYLRPGEDDDEEGEAA